MLDNKCSLVCNHLFYLFPQVGDDFDKSFVSTSVCVLFGSVYSQSFLCSCSSNQQVSLAIKKDWEKGGVSFQHNNFFVLFFLGKIYLEFFVFKIFFNLGNLSSTD